MSSRRWSGTDPKNPVNSDGHPNYVDQANFDLNYQPMSNSYPATTAGQYAVKAGDTLKGIALASYGDASLWYLIADANGLRGDGDLRIGQTLVVPTRVGGAHNTAETFQPYDPSKIVGDTSPNLPVPQQSGGGCGAVGIILTIIIAAVAVAVTVFTAGVASEALAALGPVASTLIGGAVGGAAGSLASQFTANLLEVQNGFDWKEVALGAVGGAVGAGAGLAFKSVADVGNSLANWAIAGAKSAVSNAATQGIGVLFHLQKDFSWRAVAQAAVGAGVGAAVSQAMDGALNYNKGFNFGKSLVSSTVSSFASGVAVQAMRGGRIDVLNVAADAFGNALGDSLGAQFNVSKAEEKAKAQRALAEEQARANGAGMAGQGAVDAQIGQRSTGGRLGLLSSMVLGGVDGGVADAGGGVSAGVDSPEGEQAGKATNVDVVGTKVVNGQTIYIYQERQAPGASDISGGGAQGNGAYPRTLELPVVDVGDSADAGVSGYRPILKSSEGIYYRSTDPDPRMTPADSFDPRDRVVPGSMNPEDLALAGDFALQMGKAGVALARDAFEGVGKSLAEGSAESMMSRMNGLAYGRARLAASTRWEC